MPRFASQLRAPLLTAAALIVPVVSGITAIATTPAAATAQLAPLPPALPRTHTPVPTVPAITAGDLMTRLYIYADDSMAGREVGTPGNVKATDYIAAEVKRMGLTPGGDNGSYFQTLPLTVRVLAPNSALRIITATNAADTTRGDSLALYDDFLPISDRQFSQKNIQVIYAGHEGDTTLSRSQVAGKLVIFAPSPGQRGLPYIEGAAGVAVAMLDVIPQAELNRIRRPQAVMPDTRRRQRNEAPLVLVRTTSLIKLFGKPMEALKPGTKGKFIDLTFSYVNQPAPYPGRNVVAILKGSDPALAGEYVAIGAHNDHIGMSVVPLDHDSVRAYNHLLRTEGADQSSRRPTEEQRELLNAQVEQLRRQYNNGAVRLDSIYNGADDDGSGTTSVLEIAEYLSSLPVKPKRSILFVWHTGEEKGLWGSEWFTDHPTVPRDSIVTQLNIDMIGRGDASDIPNGSPSYVQLVGSRRLSTELGDLIERVNGEDHHNLTFDYTFDAPGHPQQIYCRSDHYSYARYGIPVTFFTTGGHPDYHQITDEPEYIDYAHMARVATFISDVAIHVANLDHRPVVDKAKPNPHGSCVQ